MLKTSVMMYSGLHCKISALASMEWLHLLVKQIGIDWNLTDSVFYNISFSLLVFACENDNLLQTTNKEHTGISEEEKLTEESQNSYNLLDHIASFFTSTSINPANESKDLGCTSVFQYVSAQSISVLIVLWVSLLGIIAFSFLVLYLISKVCSTSYVKVLNDQNNSSVTEELSKVQENLEESSTAFKKNSLSNLNRPLTLHVLRVDKQVLCQLPLPTEQLLEDTVGRFLKELDFYLSVEISPSLNGTVTNSPGCSPSSSTLSTVTSPRLSRKFPIHNRQSPRSLPAVNIKKVNESSVQSWIKFEEIKQRMSWHYPIVQVDAFDFSQLSGANRNLCTINQFLQQNCTVKPQQWTIATMVVNYCLFILEDILKTYPQDTKDYLLFSKFESIGSAADGTLIGSPNRFDLLMVLDIIHCSEIGILHGNVAQEIPAGHVVINLKDCGPILQNVKCTKKGCIQNQFGLYLIPREFKDAAEMMLKRVIQKLNRDFKNKWDNLPFSIHLSSDKKLTLKVDTRLLNGLGIGVDEINIRIIPALSLSLPEFSLLSTVYAVPPWKDGNTFDNLNTITSKSTLNRVFRDQSNEDFFWSLCTDKLKMSVIKNFDDNLRLAGVEGYHKECVMILKALFSHGHKNKLLNKGEIDSFVLSTVVYFLLQESSPSCWTLARLPDRVSDAIHFLRSAFEINWMPSFLVHNPHLVNRCPPLDGLSPLLSGKQQNLLAHVSSDVVLKILEFMETRLQETGLSQCIKEDFSSEMWEYEFFVFG
ncbi:hypothetical protein Btru_007863 [Bulinus truncatus]|nr:hypothetical protein Btru_007863 [Bulinus truncatus]